MSASRTVVMVRLALSGALAGSVLGVCGCPERMTGVERWIVADDSRPSGFGVTEKLIPEPDRLVRRATVRLLTSDGPELVAETDVSWGHFYVGRVVAWSAGRSECLLRVTAEGFRPCSAQVALVPGRPVYGVVSLYPIRNRPREAQR